MLLHHILSRRPRCRPRNRAGSACRARNDSDSAIALSPLLSEDKPLLDYLGDISARDVFEVHDVVDLAVGPLCPFNSHCAGTSAGAPLSLIKSTRNFAGLVLLAFRSTT